MRDGGKTGRLGGFGPRYGPRGWRELRRVACRALRFTRNGKAALCRLVSTESDAAPARPRGRKVVCAVYVSVNVQKSAARSRRMGVCSSYGPYKLACVCVQARTQERRARAFRRETPYVVNKRCSSCPNCCGRHALHAEAAAERARCSPGHLAIGRYEGALPRTRETKEQKTMKRR